MERASVPAEVSDKKLGWLVDLGDSVVVSALITPIFGPDLCQENKGTISSKEAPILCKA